MTPLLAEGRLPQVLASGLLGLGAALMAWGGMILFQKQPPEAVEDQPPGPPPPARASKARALLLILAGLGAAVAGLLWRTSLPL